MSQPARAVGMPVWAILGSTTCVQLGAAFAKGLFGDVSPTGMTWLRVTWSVALLLILRAATRASRRGAARRRGVARDWPIGLGYAACLIAMNWSIYQAFSRIPLGVAVTIEFLGPLGVAIAGARRLRHLVWAGLAGLGVVVLEWSPTSLDAGGVGFALVAAACWAGYILLGRRAGRTWPGLDVLTLACGIGAVVLAAPAVVANGHRLADWHVVLTGAAIGLLSSVIPYGLELYALPRLPARVFGILMSLEPVAAALAALLVIHERLGGLDWIAMACIVAASVGATLEAERYHQRSPAS